MPGTSLHTPIQGLLVREKHMSTKESWTFVNGVPLADSDGLGTEPQHWQRKQAKPQLAFLVAFCLVSITGLMFLAHLVGPGPNLGELFETLPPAEHSIVKFLLLLPLGAL